MKLSLPSGFPWVLAFLPLAVLAEERSFQGKGVTASMFSEASTIAPGQTFTVALTLRHEPGFHTYWKNPGTVGMPTQIAWKLPLGFKAGELEWQSPERSKMFKYDVYGYEGNTTLLVKIKAPEILPKGPVSLRAKTSWMACNDSSCNPGYHTFELTLSTGEKTIWDSKAKKLVGQARANFPQPLPKLQAKVEPKGNKMRILVEGDAIAGLQPGPDLHFFSSLNHYKVDARQKIRLSKRGLHVILTKTDYAPDKIDRVEGVLRFPAKQAGSKGSSHVLIQAKVD